MRATRVASATLLVIAILALSPLALTGVTSLAPHAVQASSDSAKLIIYTYDWFFGMTADYIPNETYNILFRSFEQKYGVEVEVHFFDGARNAFLRVLNEKKSGVRTADLIIGVDNLIVQEGKREGIFEKINATELENLTKVKQDLIEFLDPELYAVPYDFSPLAFIYDAKRINITELRFESFYKQSLAEKLVVEDPTQSSVGISFLAWEIAIYSGLLHKDWREWWERVKDFIDVEPSWSDAYYSVFMDEAKGRPIVVSYLTSPIYHYLYEGEEAGARFRPMLVKYNGSWWSWFQVQGVAVVKDSPMREYAYKFIDWLLSDEVQRLTYSADIMLPASEAILNSLPSDIIEVMGYNISEVKAANEFLPPSVVYSNISGWLREWESIMRASPAEISWFALWSVFAVGIAALVIILTFYRRRRLPRET